MPFQSHCYNTGTGAVTTVVTSRPLADGVLVASLLTLPVTRQPIIWISLLQFTSSMKRILSSARYFVQAWLHLLARRCGRNSGGIYGHVHCSPPSVTFYLAFGIWHLAFGHLPMLLFSSIRPSPLVSNFNYFLCQSNAFVSFRFDQ